MSGLLIRLGYAVYGPRLNEQVWSDMKIYTDISDKISRGIWEQNHFFQSIGYPLFISLLRMISRPPGILLNYVQAVCSFLTLFFMYRLTLLSLGRKVALGALLVGTLHLPWILYANFALPETLFTTLLSICGLLSFKIVKSEKLRAVPCITFGVLFIMALWLKGTHVFWAPLFLCGLILVKRKQSVVPVMIIGTVLATGLAVHGLLAYQKTGKMQFSSSAGGLNFVEGKCPSKKNMDSAGYTWHSPLYFQLGMDLTKKWNRPFTDSGHFMKEGLRCIQKDPFVLIQSLESIPYLFFGNVMWPFNTKPIAPYTRLYELFFAIFLVVGFCCFVIRERDSHVIIIWLLPALSIFLTVYIFKSEIRYRVPFDVWFIPIAVKGWYDHLRTQ
jgi:hypothetical protein